MLYKAAKLCTLKVLILLRFVILKEILTRSQKRIVLRFAFFIFEYVLYLYSVFRKNGHLYKGSTENLERRVEEHNSGLVNYTSKYLPWKLIYYEMFKTRSEAIKREFFFKSGKGRALLKEIILKIKSEGFSPPQADES